MQLISTDSHILKQSWQFQWEAWGFLSFFCFCSIYCSERTGPEMQVLVFNCWGCTVNVMQSYLSFYPTNDIKTHLHIYIHARKRGNRKLYLLSLFLISSHGTRSVSLHSFKKYIYFFLPVLPMEIIHFFCSFYTLLAERIIWWIKCVCWYLCVAEVNGLICGSHRKNRREERMKW